MRVGSLFSGIGGLDFGHAPEWFCERDPFARRVLAARFPGVPVYDDVTTLSGPPPVDVLTGGFPCQDVSLAGGRAGIDGARTGLWRHMLRLTDEIRPRVVIAENVANIQRSMADIVREYEAIGYRMEATRIAASDVGAPHERMRLLILAWREDVPMPWPVDDFGGTWCRLRARGVMVPRWRDAPLLRALLPTLTVKGNDNRAGASPTSGDGLATALRRMPTLRASDSRSPGASAGADGSPPLSAVVRRNLPTLTARDWKSSATGTQGNARPLSEHVDGPLNPRWCEAFMGFPMGWSDPDANPEPCPGWPYGTGGQYDWEPPQTVLPRSVPNRPARIKCLGNAVVPQVAAIAWARVHAALP